MDGKSLFNDTGLMTEFNIEEVRKQLGLSKVEMAEKLGICRANYYKMLESGKISRKLLIENADLFGIDLPDDFYKYTSRSLLASMHFHRMKVSEIADIWGEGFTEKNIRKLMYADKNLYVYRELFEKTFDPVVVPCKYEKGKFFPA